MVEANFVSAAELEVELEWKVIDLMRLEHKNAEFIKVIIIIFSFYFKSKSMFSHMIKHQVNPQHTIPLLIFNDVVIADSHSICTYLSEKFGETDRLYPKDLVKRSLVDSRLHFDSGHLFARMRFLYEPILYNKSSEMPEDRIQYIQTAWDIMERFLENSLYVCGDKMTIVDLCLSATESLTEICSMDQIAHRNVIMWLQRMSQLPYYEELNRDPSKKLQTCVIELQKKNAGEF
ncbi:glutathione S-transferase 1-like [Contarinia nasturtii]|uniref:glutathione S-transferase 1-like n=1 Tax=Contarinia nasturtii TaxID=265458 RepID=UPI0012D3A9B4|nr:glutathione S-transferase 1-like [Contarinia nasturtii]